jgi:protein subunit release factor A
MDIKDFEKWNLTREDFKIDTYRGAIFDDVYNHGVTITLFPYYISVSCHSERGQQKNKDKCLEMLDIILNNYINRRS